ncbi:MAG: DNA-processing protein DprA [Actinomycetota bacterium]|nr:DNA-processing protein DprA [Actinomycetota bacterium]
MTISASAPSPSDHERIARAALCRVSEPAEVELGRLVEQSGAAEVWDALCRGEGLGLPPRLLAGLRTRLPAARPEADLAALSRLGGRLICPGDEQWPAGVDALGEVRPLALWARGPLHLSSAAAGAVAMVGARAATAYGAHVAGDIAAGLAADFDRTVVSGGAYGVDGAAHRGALAVGGRTIAVLACGVDVPYPRGHEALLGKIAEHGLLLSEWPPGCSPQRHRFLIRNRVIAAATAGTVVVEAAARSGALNTAGSALRLDRPVMAVPGPVTSAMSVGCHVLLREVGVRLVTTAAEVVEEVGHLGSDLAEPPRGPVDPRDELSTLSRRVLDGVPARRGAGPASIARAAGVDVSDVLRCLGPLELTGLVERTPDGFRLSRTGRSTSPTESGPHVATQRPEGPGA